MNEVDNIYEVYFEKVEEENEDYEEWVTPSLFAFSFLVAWAAGCLMALSNKSTKPVRHGFYYAAIASSVMVLLFVSL